MADRTDSHAMTIAGLNLIQQALSIYDSSLRLIVCNARFREMFDLPHEMAIPGAHFEDTIRHLVTRGEYGPVDDIEQAVRDRVETARAFKPHYMERTRANGRTISVEGTPLPQGGWVTVYTDITRVKRQESLLQARSDELSGQLSSYAEELTATNRQLEATIIALEEAQRQLTASEARTRSTAEMMPAHIAHVGRDGRYTFSNRRLSTVMPDSSSDIVGLQIDEVLGPHAFTAIEPRLAEAFDGKPSVFEFSHEPSSRRIRVAFTPDDTEGGVYILSMDITEEAQTRAALQQTRRREIAAQLTSGLAHDFSNLLTIILGMQSKLQSKVVGEDAQSLISATIAAAHRGGGLLNGIADMTGPRAHTPNPTDLAIFLHNLETLALSTLPEGVSLSIDNKISTASYQLDAGMLQDSLLNLILNARDACGATGQITLSVGNLRDTWLEFRVEDTGPGFSKAALQKGLDPFFTTKAGEGSGLGLTMVYDMTKLAGGRLHLSNTVRGGCVTIRLPLRIVDQLREPGLVLLVEDSPDLRDTVRGMLREAGHTVVEASSVTEALSLLADLPEISALLSDISLEGEDTGLDLFGALPEGHCPAFFITSLPPDDPRFIAARSRAPVLRKPFDAAALAGMMTKGEKQ